MTERDEGIGWMDEPIVRGKIVEIDLLADPERLPGRPAGYSAGAAASSRNASLTAC
jgi:hypothetical protein